MIFAGKRMANAYLVQIHAKEITQSGITDVGIPHFWVKWNSHEGERYRILSATNLMERREGSRTLRHLGAEKGINGNRWVDLQRA